MRYLTLILAASSFAFTGCIVLHEHDRGHAWGRDHHELRSTPQCHPSEYWDGEHCVHNGRGHGARKHDH